MKRIILALCAVLIAVPSQASTVFLRATIEAPDGFSGQGPSGSGFDAAFFEVTEAGTFTFFVDGISDANPDTVLILFEDVDANEIGDVAIDQRIRFDDDSCPFSLCGVPIVFDGATNNHALIEDIVLDTGNYFLVPDFFPLELSGSISVVLKSGTGTAVALIPTPLSLPLLLSALGAIFLIRRFRPAQS